MKTCKMPPKGKLSDREIAVADAVGGDGCPGPARRRRPGRSRGRRIDVERGREFWAFRPPVDPADPRGPRTDPGPGRRSTASSWRSSRRAGLRPAPAGRQADADPPGDLRPDRPAADARGGRRLPRRRLARRLRQGRRPAARLARTTASAGAGTGSTWPATPTPTAWTRTSPTATPGATATTSSPRSTRDKPYDQFLLEQLAGDLLPPTATRPTRHERLIATGFLALGPKVLAEVDETKMEMDIVDEQIDTRRPGVPGPDARLRPLPRPQVRPDRHGRLLRPGRHLQEHADDGDTSRRSPAGTRTRWPPTQDRRGKAEHEQQVAAQKEAIEALIGEANERLQAEVGPESTLPEGPETLYPDETKAELKRLRDELAELEKAAPELPDGDGRDRGEGRRRRRSTSAATT